jgi:tRNA-dihydrouridine synthase B
MAWTPRNAYAALSLRDKSRITRANRTRIKQMTIQLAGISLDPPVFLAPMAGITDLPTRTLVASFGAGLVVSEMIASREVLSESRSARARAELGLGQDRTAVQIAGRDADLMAESARMVEAGGARIIDINMGCPAKKVTSGYSGSALMRDPDHALRLVEAVVQAVAVPVTLKMRLGWDDVQRNAPEIARRAEEAGIQMITVHGRTRCQFYKGEADWQAIRAVKQAVRVPVVANGDITTPQAARTALALSGADGVMVGRGAQGKPWMLADIAASIGCAKVPKRPQGLDLFDMIRGHYEAILAFYGAPLGIRTARKHLGWYMDDLGAAPDTRRVILTATDPKTVLSGMRSLCLRAEERCAA